MANSRRLPPCVASEPAERIADIVRRLMCGSGRTRRLSVAQGCTTTCAPGHVVSGPYVWRQLHPVRIRRAENRAVTVSGRNSLGDDRLVHCGFGVQTCRERKSAARQILGSGTRRGTSGVQSLMTFWPHALHHRGTTHYATPQILPVRLPQQQIATLLSHRTAHLHLVL
jgi:hypothetical protein